MQPSEQTFGGNLVSIPALGNIQTFATTPYVYQQVTLKAGESHSLTLPSCTAFVRIASPAARITVNDQPLTKGDSAQLENTHATLHVQEGEASFLIAGVQKPAKPEASLSITPAASQYKVTKPWGYELWLNGEHPAYVIKELFLLQGKRTSLQYHEVKRETVVLFQGNAGLVYKKDDSVPNMDVLEANLAETTLTPLSVLNTFPNTMHRMVAQTDILYYEASTPELDDVIRVHDDSGRGQGRIQSEHQRAA